MAFIKEAQKVQELALKVYNSSKIAGETLNIEDEDAIKKLCSAVFSEDGETPSLHKIHEFNNIIVKVATKVSEPDVQQLLKYFADVQNVPAGTQMVEHKKSIAKNIKNKWAAIGSAVSLKKVETGGTEFIHVGIAQTGITYDPITNSKNQVEAFRELVSDIAAARVRLIYDTIMGLIETAVSSNTTIPAKQVVNGANVSIAQFDTVANILGRRTGSRPLFVADRELITSIASKKVTLVDNRLPDSLKLDYYNVELTNLGTADAIPLVNDFTTETGFETKFPVDTGYILGSANGRKPFSVALAGGITQDTEKDVEYGRIKVFIRQALGVDFLYAGNIGVIKDTGVSI